MATEIDPLDFAGKVALVTGSSRGIGAAIVQMLNEHGARCIVNYVADPAGRNRADADAVATSLKDARVIECDVAVAAQVEAMMQTIRQDLGGLDILVNNAGILRDRSLKKMTLDDWNAVLQVNLGGPFLCIRAALEVLRDGGRIVNLASVAAFTKVAARELAKRRITVNAVAPGFIQTDMTRDMPPDVTKAFLQQIPLGRMGSVEDIAGVVAFLCSPLADYVTGQILHVNGGFLMP